jgi:hypothetical protein
VLSYRVRDNLSPQARTVVLTIRNSHGKLIKRLSLGSAAISTWHSLRWVSKVKGVYHYTVTATDLAGNHEVKADRAAITVT